MSQTAPITSANPTVAEMEALVARFKALSATDDYVDAQIPGCERTTYRVLGTQPEAPLAAQGFHLNSLVLAQLDTITIPPGVSRGFRNISETPAYRLGMASGQDPGNINWPAQVRAAALAVGVALP